MEKSMTTYNTVLINTLPMRHYKSECGIKGASRDGSFIPYIAEELIARSAYKVAIGIESENFKNSLPNALSRRVEFFNQLSSLKKTQFYLTPLYEEHGVTDHWGGFSIKDGLDHEQKKTANYLVAVKYWLQKYLFAIEKNLQIDIELHEFLAAVREVRSCTRGNEGRARLALLEGLLTSYKQIETASLLLSLPDSPQGNVEYFQRLTEDASYLELSKAANEVGYSDKINRSLQLMRRAVYDVLSNSLFKKSFNEGTKIITAATDIHIPDAEFAESLLAEGYLPPIVSLAKPMANALELWKKHSPDLIHVGADYLPRDFRIKECEPAGGEKWEEIFKRNI